mgnify:CR=1 FL=1
MVSYYSLLFSVLRVFFCDDDDDVDVDDMRERESSERKFSSFSVFLNFSRETKTNKLMTKRGERERQKEKEKERSQREVFEKV